MITRTTVTKALLYLQIGALMVVSSLGGPVGSLEGEPFHGSTNGDETYSFEGDDLLTSGGGGGIASHFGRFTATWESISQPFLPGNFGVTSYQLIAANGDSLFIEASGQADASGFPVVTLVEDGTITGGTGRFDGASGSILCQRVINITSQSTDTTSGSFIGTILLSKAH